MHPRISPSTPLLLIAACATSAVAQDVLPKPVTAPARAPNALIVILDDVGFGHVAPSDVGMDNVSTVSAVARHRVLSRGASSRPSRRRWPTQTIEVK